MRIDCLFIFLFLVGGTFARTLLQVQLVHRHGDRTPLTELPNGHVDWQKELGTRPGQLTGTGIKQTRQLGIWLRQRYFDEFNFLPENFDDAAVRVFSTEVDRTIASARYVSQELFANTKRFDDINNNTEIGVVPPIHMVQQEDDLLRAVDICPQYLNQRLQEVYDSEDWQNFEKSSRVFRERFANYSGFPNGDLDKFGQYFDPVFVQHQHGLLAIPELSSTIGQIVEVADFAEYQRKHVGGELTGGPLLSRWGKSMADFLVNATDSRSFIHYSAHDSTVMSAMSAMKADTADRFQKIPNYASAFVVELWRENNGDLTVNALFRDGVTEEVHNVQEFPHTYQEFQELVAENGLDGVAWCEACGSGFEILPATCLRAKCNVDDNSKHEDKEKHLATYFALGFAGLFVLSAGACVLLLCQLRARKFSEDVTTPLNPNA